MPSGAGSDAASKLGINLVAQPDLDPTIPIPPNSSNYGMITGYYPLTYNSKMDASLAINLRFPGGSGSVIRSNAGALTNEATPMGALRSFLHTAKDQGATRLWFVTNLHNVYHKNLGNEPAYAWEPGTPPGNCTTNYTVAHCRAAMATYAGNWAERIRVEIENEPYYGSWRPNIVFEIGNEVTTGDNGLTNTSPVGVTSNGPENYIADINAYRNAIVSPTRPYKIAVSGKETFGGNSIWQILKDRGVDYDFAVIHDYGWTPSMITGTSTGAATTVTKQQLQGVATVIGDSRQIALTEFGTPNCKTEEGCSTQYINDYYTQERAALNEAIQLGIYSSVDSSRMAAMIKWPSKALPISTTNPSTKETGFRAWEPGGNDGSATPVYFIYKMLAPMLKGAYIGTYDPFASQSGMYAYVKNTSTAQYLTIVNASDYPKQLTLASATSLTLEAVVPAATPINAPACTKNSVAGFVTFQIPQKSVVLVKK